MRKVSFSTTSAALGISPDDLATLRRRFPSVPRGADEDAFLAMASEVGASDTAVEWLVSRNIMTAQDLAFCAPTEELLMSTVIHEMPTADMRARSRVAAMWNLAQMWRPALSHSSKTLSDSSPLGPTLARADTTGTNSPVLTSRLASFCGSLQMRRLDASKQPRKLEAEFWCNQIMKQRKRNTTDTREAIGPVEVLYDLSAEAVSDFFESLDVNQDGCLAAGELAHGLRKQGFELDQTDALQIILQVTGTSEDTASQAGVEKSEFDFILKCLRLAELFTPAVANKIQCVLDCSSLPIACCDYNLNFCKSFVPTDIKSFCFGSRQSDKTAPRSRFTRQQQDVRKDSKEAVMRWVHVDACRGLDDRLTLYRLAVKFHLHPIALKDVLHSQTSTKMDSYEDNLVIFADILSLSGDISTPAAGQEPSRVRIHRSHVCMFLAGRHRTNCFDTLLSIYQERPDESSWMAKWRSGGLPASQPSESIWETLRKDLEAKPTQRMRGKPADFLLYEALYRIVRQLRPITEAYANRLGFMSQNMEKSKKSAQWMREIGDVKLELVDVTRSVRPLRQIIRRFVDDDKVTTSVKLFLNEVVDGIDVALEDITQLHEMSKCLEDTHKQNKDNKLNASLRLLSIMSAAFLPLQFVTGVYGMNFAYKDGTASMPELTWDYGYLYFWIVEAVLAVVTLVAVLWLFDRESPNKPDEFKNNAPPIIDSKTGYTSLNYNESEL